MWNFVFFYKPDEKENITFFVLRGKFIEIVCDVASGFSYFHVDYSEIVFVYTGVPRHSSVPWENLMCAEKILRQVASNNNNKKNRNTNIQHFTYNLLWNEV